MRKLRVGLATMILLGTAFSTLRVSGEAGADQQVSTQESFRLNVTDLIHEEDIMVTQVEIGAKPGSYVEVVSDQPNRGGVGAASPEPGPTNQSPRTRLMIVGDHVVWEAGATNALKFLMRITGGSGTVTMTVTGPMPKGKRLAAAVSVLVEPGEYRYGEATKLVRFQDVTYSLIVKTRK